MTAKEFMALRLANGFDGKTITVWLDDQIDAQTKDVVIREGEVKRVDVRALAGLPVFLHADTYSQALTVLVDRIKQHTAFLFVAIASFGEDLGWKVVNGELVEL